MLNLPFRILWQQQRTAHIPSIPSPERFRPQTMPLWIVVSSNADCTPDFHTFPSVETMDGWPGQLEEWSHSHEECPPFIWQGLRATWENMRSFTGKVCWHHGAKALKALMDTGVSILGNHVICGTEGGVTALCGSRELAATPAPSGATDQRQHHGWNSDGWEQKHEPNTQLQERIDDEPLAAQSPEFNLCQTWITAQRQYVRTVPAAWSHERNNRLTRGRNLLNRPPW